CWRSPLAPGSSQSCPLWMATPDTVGTTVPAGSSTVVCAPTRCGPAATVTEPSTVEPSSSPRTPKVVSAAKVSVAAWSSTTVVVCGKTAPAGGDSAGRPSLCHWNSRNTTGTASAVSLSQYWNACTNVIARIPPSATLAVTTPPTSRAPSA